MTFPEWMKQLREAREKATGGKYNAERVAFDDGSFAYEFHGEERFVAFYERSYRTKPMRAKFDAEFFALAANNWTKILDALEGARDALVRIEQGLGHELLYQRWHSADGPENQREAAEVTMKALLSIKQEALARLDALGDGK